MDALQLVIVTMGLAGQVLIARKNAIGYAFWIVGNVSLIFMYQGLHRYGLVGLQIVNTMIQLHAIRCWIRDRSRGTSREPSPSPVLRRL